MLARYYTGNKTKLLLVQRTCVVITNLKLLFSFVKSFAVFCTNNVISSYIYLHDIGWTLSCEVAYNCL
jgi:hypothetical protein